MQAAKVYKASSPVQPAFPRDYSVVAVQDLTFTDVVHNNNKYYHLEVQVAKTGAARVHSEYGRVGAKNPAKEFRYGANEAEARAIFDAIVREKTGRARDPYVKVDLCQREVGSAGARAVVKPLRLVGAASAPAARSSLHPEIERVVRHFFSSTGRFVETNLKCPLGQLSREQIDQGRAVLDRAKVLLNAGADARSRRREFDELTNQFYSLIPHNFGYAKLDPDALRLDALGRVAQKEADLDVFLDAKSVAKGLAKGAAVDEQYASLGADLAHVPPGGPVFAWVERLLHATRAKNHGFLGKISVKSVLAVRRKGEGDFGAPTPFLANAEKIARELSGGSFLRRTLGLGPSAYDAPHVRRVEDRPDLDPRLCALYAAANVWPAWHGTRNANMTGVISRGLLIRPAGAVHAGSMFGDGIYFAHQSSKAINYTSARGSYWASGADDVGYLLLADVAFGKMHVAPASHFFRGPPAGCHSVYGKQGATRGLVNDEMIVYQPTGPAQQHAIRYVVEIHTEPGARALARRP
jgi:predicted DNA-binding WGR domain protein